MGRQSKKLEGLSLLGNQGTKYDFGYNPEVLEVNLTLLLYI